MDLPTYKMAKSYVYLTNINVSLVNFANKTSGVVKINLVSLIEDPMFEKEDAKKL